MAAIPKPQPPTAAPPETVEECFRRLEAIWTATTGYLSDYTAIIEHPAFREIVGLGEAVVPLMLHDLEERPRLWVWALPEITGANPVPAEDGGNIAKMSEAWLRWGRANGYQLFSIELSRFNNAEHIENRITLAPAAECGALRTALGYLYRDDGPVNLPRERLLVAERHLEAAERVVIRWLYTRTNGSLRSSYGAAALHAARLSRYRCEVCKFADVRVLNLDHVNGRVSRTPFACLCANCHTIKSRAHDWTGEKPEAEEPEEGAD